MNKENFKCLVSLLCVLGGLIFSYCSYIFFDTTTPSFVASMIMSICLTLLGAGSYLIHAKNHKIITTLKSNDTALLAKWSYHPNEFEIVKQQFEEDRHITFSLILLLSAAIFFIGLGMVFSNHTLNAVIYFMLLFLLVILSMISFWGVARYYDTKLHTPHDAIISDQYIYFKSELYAVQKSFYYLESVDVLTSTQNYLQFVYGAPGTPFGPFQTLSIPIPDGQLETAYLIKEHYLSLIQS